MSELSPETNPQILVNGQEKDNGEQENSAEERMFSFSLDDKCSKDSDAAEKKTQTKRPAIFQQVGNQIRSQVGMKAPKSSILELVQRVKDREIEIALANGECESKNVSSEEKKQDVSTRERKDEMDLKEEELCAIFEEKLEASKNALRDEFEVQISQVRKEMQAYTDQALKDLKCKTQSWQSHNLQQAYPKKQQEGKGPDKKQKPPALASRRGRVLTRTMTTITPKTCAPVVIGPRAKSETLSSSKRENSQLFLRDPVPSLPGKKTLLPSACPPVHQGKKPVRAKAKTASRL